ncbi:MAG: calcium-binding protein, partial [Devosia sp.]
KDEFAFNTKLGPANVDTLGDFAHNTDLIHLGDTIFKTIGPTLDGVEFYAKAQAVKAHDADDRIIYDTSTGKLYYDDDGNKAGGHAAVHFATLSTKPVVDAGDFLVV